MAAAVQVKNARKRYRKKVALDGVDLTVEAGRTVGILGRNGAGKTTLVETIAGLRKPDAGTARVMGLDPIADRARVRMVLGVQLQKAIMHYDLTVIENLRLHRSFYPEGRDPDELLEKLGLAPSRDTRFGRLSGGQAQRLSVAAALVGRPRVVILDELTTGLDPEGRRGIWRVIESLREEGVTILLVSHAMDEVARLCDHVVVLDEGRVRAEGTPEELVSQAGATNLEQAFLSLVGATEGELDTLKGAA
ncbi:ABC transporter ATP-binding protein [Bogoriella caseilytica]|uniref:ABC-2 type transport system ATP-binding protein n=1 Tax=Bogoriella caseilytica TaxID=56055 RepID=A0A3N2BA39_9MICO|nr:ABC transporter ATP-binding protein [Bogoriella caseilytica]ROR72058.1 ABC-2 type transport system ATP-binding protein [Bogoriella caseilytica]